MAKRHSPDQRRARKAPEWGPRESQPKRLTQGILTVAETREMKFKHLRFAALRAMVGAKYPITKVNLDWI